MPEVYRLSTFRLGMPASLAGDVPSPFGLTKIRYLKNPKRKSATQVALGTNVAPYARLWLRTEDTPANPAAAKLDPPASEPNAPGASCPTCRKLYRPNI